MSKILLSPRKYKMYHAVNKTTQSQKTNQHSFCCPVCIDIITHKNITKISYCPLIFRDVFKSSYIEDITRWREDMTFIFEW
jgi:hypothetical protein